MTISNAILIIVLCAIAGSFTWGMRGTIIGGERGAMLPGAALGLILLHAGGVEPLSVLFPVAATAGACGMFFGGNETYGDTIGMSLGEFGSKAKGRLGLFIKGAVWFGIFGGILALSLAALAGRFSIISVSVFALLLIVVHIFGHLLSALLRKSKIASVLNFSKNRKESWITLCLICVYLLVFSIIRKEWFAVLMIVFGIVSGGLGFFIGNIFEYLTSGPLSNCKFLLGKMQEKGYVDSWKFMECTFGAIGGIGVSLCFCIFYNSHVLQYVNNIIAHSGHWTAFGQKQNTLFTFIWLALFVLYALRYFFKEKEGDLLSKILFDCEDAYAFAVFCYIPLFLSLTGNMFACEIYSVSMLLFVLSEKVVLGNSDVYGKIEGKYVFYPVLILLTVGAFFVQIFTNVKFSASQTLLIYILSYILTEVYVQYNPMHLKALSAEMGGLSKAFSSLGPKTSWLIYATVCGVAIMTLSIFVL